MLKKWHFTFGFNQLHQGCYTVIEAENSQKAREEMFQRWGRRWAMQYDSAEAAGVEEFHLRKIL